MVILDLEAHAVGPTHFLRKKKKKIQKRSGFSFKMTDGLLFCFFYGAFGKRCYIFCLLSILYSASLKQVALLELTIPWEERIEEASGRKRAEYQELVEQFRGAERHTASPSEWDAEGSLVDHCARST